MCFSSCIRQQRANSLFSQTESVKAHCFCPTPVQKVMHVQHLNVIRNLLEQAEKLTWAFVTCMVDFKTSTLLTVIAQSSIAIQAWHCFVSIKSPNKLRSTCIIKVEKVACLSQNLFERLANVSLLNPCGCIVVSLLTTDPIVISVDISPAVKFSSFCFNRVENEDNRW